MNLVSALGLPLPGTLRKPLPPSGTRFSSSLKWAHFTAVSAGRQPGGSRHLLRGFPSPPGWVHSKCSGDVTDAFLPRLFLSPTETTETVVKNRTLGPDGLGFLACCDVASPSPSVLFCKVGILMTVPPPPGSLRAADGSLRVKPQGSAGLRGGWCGIHLLNLRPLPHAGSAWGWGRGDERSSRPSVCVCLASWSWLYLWGLPPAHRGSGAGLYGPEGRAWSRPQALRRRPLLPAFAQQVSGCRMTQAQTGAGGSGKGRGGSVQGWLRNGDRKGPLGGGVEASAASPCGPAAGSAVAAASLAFLPSVVWAGFLDPPGCQALSGTWHGRKCVPLWDSRSDWGDAMSKIKYLSR